MSSEDYDLAKSSRKLGKLYPILKDAHGNIIDGFNRQNSDPEWPCIVVGTIDSPVKLELARLAANFCRRNIPASELEQRIRFLVKSGLKPEQIAEETGISEATIYRHMPTDLKPTSEAISQGRQEQVARATSVVRNAIAEGVECERCHVTTSEPEEWHGHKLCPMDYKRATLQPEAFDGYFKTLAREKEGKVPKIEKPVSIENWQHRSEHMKVQHSKTELTLLTELTSLGITPHVDYPIAVVQTIPDGVYPTHKICYYVDGEPHKGSRLDRDEQLRGMLERQGWTVLSFREGSPKEWAKQVQEALKF